MASNSSITSRVTKSITPECENVRDPLVLVAAIILVLMFIIFVLSIAIAIYSQYADAANDSEKDKKAKTIQNLTIVDAVLAFIGVIVGVWLLIAGNKIAKCASSKSKMGM